MCWLYAINAREVCNQLPIFDQAFRQIWGLYELYVVCTKYPLVHLQSMLERFAINFRQPSLNPPVVFGNLNFLLALITHVCSYYFSIKFPAKSPLMPEHLFRSIAYRLWTMVIMEQFVTILESPLLFSLVNWFWEWWSYYNWKMSNIGP